MAKKIVIALGGNATGHNHAQQLERLKICAQAVCDLVQQGYSIVITHGNGPQLGLVNDTIKRLAATNPKYNEIPFSARIAMTQAYIGGDLKNALMSEFSRRGIEKHVASVFTRVEVDEKDPAFENPTKPIGEFMTQDEAKALSQSIGVCVMEDAGRGYRTVVPSPRPVKIKQFSEIQSHLADGEIVITCGGGGLPVIRQSEGFKEVYAVIDKDYVSALLAQNLAADCLLILTGIDCVTINYRTPNEKPLHNISVDEAKRYIDAGQFAPGSMLPKMEAAVQFARSKSGRQTIITSLDKLSLAMLGKAGTIISNQSLAKGRFKP